MPQKLRSFASEFLWARQVDRFIPARNAFDVDLASFKMSKENDSAQSPSTSSTPSKVSFLSCTPTSPKG